MPNSWLKRLVAQKVYTFFGYRVHTYMNDHGNVEFSLLHFGKNYILLHLY
jgi:hypothetical protein